MPSIRTNRLYNKLTDTNFSAFVGGTITGFTNNPDLPNPPVSAADLVIKKTTLDDAIVKALNGGKDNTQVKIAARVDATTALDKNASYVDIHCNDDITILLSSGYQAVNTNRAQSVLNAPDIIAVDYGQAGELKLRISADANSKSFVGRIKAVSDSEFGPSISFSSSRKLVFSGLKAGVTYVMQLCAIGGSTGQSDWTEPVTKMAV